MASDYDFLESFSERLFADRLKKIWTAGGAGAFTNGGRFGKYYYGHHGFNSLLADFGGSTTQGSSGVLSSFAIGAAVRSVASTGFGGIIFQSIGVGNGPQSISTELRYAEDGRLIVSISNGGSNLAITDLPVSLFLNIFYFIEWEVTFHESADLNVTPHFLDTKIYVDGVKVLDVSTVTVPSSQIYLNLSIINFGSAGNVDYQDMYFKSSGAFGTGARVVVLRPNGDGSFKEFTFPASGTHFDDVDEEFLDTADYIEDVVTKPVRDTFTMEDLTAAVTIPGGRNVLMSQFEYYAEGSEGGDNVFPFHYILGSTNFDGTVRGLTGLYNRKVIDSGTYTAAQIDAIEGGVKVRLD